VQINPRERGRGSFPLVLILLLIPDPLLSAPLIERVDLVVEGMGGTDPDVLRSLLSTREGVPYDPHLLEEDLRFLRGDERFRSVTAEVVEGEEEVAVTFYIYDRLALLPLFEFGAGGGVERFLLGIQDLNLRGKLVSAGAYIGLYESYKRSVIGGLFWEDPYLGRSWAISTLLFRDYFLTPFYQAITLPPSGILEEERVSGYFELFHRLTRTLSLGGFVLLRKARLRLFSGELPEPLGGYEDLFAIRSGILLRIRDLEFQNFRTRGYSALGGGYGEWRNRSLPQTPGAFGEFRLFLLPHPLLNLGGRVAVETRLAKSRYDLLRAGALSAVRGIPDAYLKGSSLLYGSLEIRTLFFEPWKEYLHLHLALFVDGGIGTSPEETISALSTGGGIRIGFPSIYGFFIRADLAYLLFPREGKPFPLSLNLGTSQFF